MIKRGTPSSSGGGAAKAAPGGAGGKPEVEAVVTNDMKKEGGSHNPVTTDELPPHLKGRIKGLIYDLSNDDLPMALLDLAHLYGALRRQSPREVEMNDEPIELTEDLRTLIFNEDRSAIEEICTGPDRHGRCPRAEEGHPVACADNWIMNKGWNFKVAPDPDVCPLVSLGLAHRYLRAAVLAKRKGD